MSRIISQREARRLQKRVLALEQMFARQRRVWGQEYIGVEIARREWPQENALPVTIRTARLLGHVVMAVGDDTDTIRFVALPHASERV